MGLLIPQVQLVVMLILCVGVIPVGEVGVHAGTHLALL